MNRWRSQEPPGRLTLDETGDSRWSEDVKREKVNYVKHFRVKWFQRETLWKPFQWKPCACWLSVNEAKFTFWIYLRVGAESGQMYKANCTICSTNFVHQYSTKKERPQIMHWKDEVGKRLKVSIWHLTRFQLPMIVKELAALFALAP